MYCMYRIWIFKLLVNVLYVDLQTVSKCTVYRMWIFKLLVNVLYVHDVDLKLLVNVQYVDLKFFSKCTVCTGC